MQFYRRPQFNGNECLTVQTKYRYDDGRTCDRQYRALLHVGLPTTYEVYRKSNSNLNNFHATVSCFMQLWTFYAKIKYYNNLLSLQCFVCKNVENI